MRETIKKSEVITALTITSITIGAIIIALSYYIASGWLV